MMEHFFSGVNAYNLTKNYSAISFFQKMLLKTAHYSTTVQNCSQNPNCCSSSAKTGNITKKGLHRGY